MEDAGGKRQEAGGRVNTRQQKRHERKQEHIKARKGIEFRKMYMTQQRAPLKLRWRFAIHILFQIDLKKLLMTQKKADRKENCGTAN